MRERRHSVRNVAIAVMVASLLSLALLGMFSGWPLQHVHAPKISQGWLTENAAGNAKDTSRKFSTVLNREFPPGSSVDAMRAKLAEQGFERPSPHLREDCASTACAYADTKNELEYDWGGLVCSQVLRASWKADARGAITELKGYYFSPCI